MWFWSFWMGWGAGHIVDAYMDYGPPAEPMGGGKGGGLEASCVYIPGVGIRCH